MKRLTFLLCAQIYAAITLLLGACKGPDIPPGIPEFSMVMPDTTQVFHSKDIPYGRNTMIIYFDPACRDCQEETEFILANMQKFAHADIYMVTRHTHKDLMVFYNHLRLDTCKNLKIGIDKTGSIPSVYKENVTPLTMIYNKEKMLTAFFRGKAKPESLTKAITEQ